MLLILTNSEDVTATYLLPHLNKAGVAYTRIDTDLVLSDLTYDCSSAGPALRLAGRWLKPEDISNVWYRRPERLRKPGAAESVETNYLLDEWSEALEGFFAHIPPERWMNHPSANAMASHKIEQLTTATRLGFKTPETLVTQSEVDLKAFFSKHAGRIIAKPLSCGALKDTEGKTKALIYTCPVKKEDLAELHDLSNCPTLFQQQLDKNIDVRITVVDSDIHAVVLRATDKDEKQRCDIRRNSMQDVSYEPCGLPYDVESKIRALTSFYKLRFAAIDMAVTNSGDWYYFEVNPNGQWAWLDIDAGLNIAESFVKSFQP